MIFYHRTSSGNGANILREGFRDGTGHYGMDEPVTGVWVSDQILDEHCGAGGDVVLRIELEIADEDSQFYEVVNEGSVYREWCIPAQLLNKGRLTIIKELD